MEQLVANRLVDHAGNHLAVPLEADGDGEMGDAVQEVERPVERVDEPAVAGVASPRPRRFPPGGSCRPGGRARARGGWCVRP